MTMITDEAGTRPLGPQPDAYGQAALLLAESILHALVESHTLTTVEAVAVVHTAAEINVEVALASGESKERMIESLNLLSAMARSFEAY